MALGDTAQPSGTFDAVTIGETLAAFIRDDTPDRYVLTAVGAESNVAVGMAQLGCRTRWASRLGRDDLGRFVHDYIAKRGVDIRIEWDDQHPTGLCVKEIGAERTRMRYYRSQSAARRLSDADADDLGTARWLHVTGVTAALSHTAADLVAAIVGRRTGHTGRVSFDVNYRPALWPDAAVAAETLVPLARQADVVFIGDDEAEVLLGGSSRRAVASQLLGRADQEVVIKRGGGAASVVTRAGHVSEPALKPKVVDLTGAGDAFAAGYLAGSCWGREPGDRLRLGHYLAARVVAVRGDIADNVDNEDVPTMKTSGTSSSVELR